MGTMHLALLSLLASPSPRCSASWPVWTRLWSRLLKTVESPQLQSIQIVDISFVAQRQFPMVQTSQLATEVPQLPFVFRWSMLLLCKSCLPYPLLRTGAQGSDSAENCRGSAVAVHQLRRQFPAVVQRLISMVLVTMEIPQLQFTDKVIDLGCACPANSGVAVRTVEIPQLRLVVFFRQCRRHPCRGADADSHGPLYHKDSPAAVHC